MTRKSWNCCRLIGIWAFTLTGILSPFSTARLAAQAPVGKAPDDPAVRAAAALYEGIRVETLPNGLRVYLKTIPDSPVVTTKVAYKVGSADEELDQTGLSHYLEHLMFKGTDKIMPGDLDRITLRNGGTNNAYTTEDYTIYHFDFAADRWEAALEIEADRMRNLRIDAKHEFEQEKGAVIEELQRNEDGPWDLEYKAILPLLFDKESPYGHPVIGERDHVRGATAAIIKAHYDKWYYPNNAVLVIVGGFDPDKAMAKVKKLFGTLPAGKLPERKKPTEVKRKGPSRLEMDSKFELARMIMGFNTITINDPDDPVLDVIQTLLSGGKTGRLYKKLIEEERIAGQVSSGNYSGRYPGWFGILVQMLQGKDRAQAEKLVLQELARLRDEPVSPAELKRVQNTVLTELVLARESPHGLADSIAQGLMTSDLEHLQSYLPRLMAVTPQDVQRAARKYFDPERRVVVWSAPKSRGQGSGVRSQRETQPARSASQGFLNQSTAAGKGDFSLKNAQRVVLPNGLTLLLYENHRLPLVVAEAQVKNARLLEPEQKGGVAVLTGWLLDEGTAKHTGPQIAEMIEDVGGTLAMSSAGGTVSVLAPHRSLGLSLLFECLTQPSFGKEAFERQHERLLSEIDDAERQPDYKGSTVYRELVYGKHPLGRPSMGRRSTVEKLTSADCVAFHKSVFVPSNTLVAVVGDFNSKEAIEEITRMTADWKGNAAAKVETPAVDQPKEFTQKVISMPEAAQLHFYMGHAGIRRNNPDYYKLLVMDYVLGTGPGFTDRLSSRMRDREGLAYTVYATISSSAGEEPGLFTCYIGTAPQNFDRVKGTFLEELARIRKEKPTDEEVEDVKKYLLGSWPFQFTTNERIAEQLLYVERHGLGFGYLDDYRKAIAAVTPDDVLSMAKKYLDPEHMVLVAAGAVNAKGQPINRIPPPKP
jgi:zinc protease